MKKRVSISRVEMFNAAHRLHNPALTNEENALLYGKCNHPNYHGHNYRLIVTVTGEVNPKSGYVIDTKILSQLVQDLIIEKFDHRNLNLDTFEFKNLIPSAENIAIVIHDLLREKIASHYDLKITLYETERNFVEYPA